MSADDPGRRWHPKENRAVVLGLLLVAVLIGLLAATTLVTAGDDGAEGDDDVAAQAPPAEPGESSPAVAKDDVTSTPSPSPSPTSTATPTQVIVVSTDASEGGDGTADRPFSSIQRALDVARPGDTVRVRAGIYREVVRSVRDGRPNDPIVVEGEDATITGGDGDVNHLIEINHDYVTFTGFHVSDASTLLSIQEATGVRVIANTFRDADGECIRIRYLSTDVEVAGNDVSGCGREDFDLDDDHKNGEGIYVGTAPEQLDDNPTDVPDATNGTWVHDNTIEVPAECVDVKEHARATVVEDNRCTGGQDPEGAGFSSRGIGTVFRGNTSTGHTGAGIRLGGDSDDDGILSTVVDNTLIDNGRQGLRIMTEPQRLICGNEVDGNDEGATNIEDLDPSRPCPS